MNRHTDGRTESGALVPLSALQRRKLVLLAREAWAARTVTRADDDCPFEIPADIVVEQSFDEWRHEQCMQAVERPGLSVCRNEDYLPLLAHFLRLLGREAQAEAMDVRAALEPRQRVMHEFQRACSAAAGVLDNPVSYAEGFLRRAEGCGIDDAPDKALWRAVYLLRRKAGLEKRKVRGNRDEGRRREDEGDTGADTAEPGAVGVGSGAAGVGAARGGTRG